MKRKAVCFCLLLCLLAALLVPAAFADMPSDGTFYYQYNASDGDYTLYLTVGKTLTDAVIPASFQGKPVTGIGAGAFQNCRKLKSVSIPDSVTTISSGAFEGCTALTSIALPESVSFVGSEAFLNCSGLTEVTIPERSISVFSDAFNGTPIYRNSANWYNGQFYVGTALISVPSDVKDCVVRPGTTLITCSAFDAIRQTVETVELPDAVRVISDYAFSQCEQLKSITIPAGLRELGQFAFDGCFQLRDVYYGGTEAQWKALIGDRSIIELQIAAIHYGSTGPEAPAPVEITAQPKSVSTKAGSTVKFTVAASGAGLSYQWQLKTPNGSWKNCTASSGKTPELSVSATAGRNGYQYRCRITDASGSTVTSAAAKLTIKTVITTQPTAVTAAAGSTVKFTVAASGAGLTYQWQLKTPNGSWKNCTASSSKTPALSVSATTGRNGYQYRCRITDANGSTVTSSAVKLTIKTVITTQPTAVTAAAGSTVKFTVAASGAGLTYQWQLKTPNGSWRNCTASSGKTPTLSVSATTGRNGYQYRCRITDANGSTVTSSAVKLTVKG